MAISEALLSEIRSLLWTDVETRRELQRHGISIVPSNFYSTVPSVEEIESSFEYSEPDPYLRSELFDAPVLRAVLLELIPFAREFDAPDTDDPDVPKGFFWNNGQFSFSDAAAYYAFIRARRPARIVEIGAGYSTLVASAAVKANGSGEIICIEPYPRPFLAAIPGVCEVVAKPAQNITADWLNDQLDDGDVLFIDSTHAVKLGSDCLHLYLRLLPSLQKRLLVHVHDVFLPQGMPRRWALQDQIYWTEQYLLMAYLLDNPLVRVLFGSAYHGAHNADILGQLTPPRIATKGGSFWFERDPGKSRTV